VRREEKDEVMNGSFRGIPGPVPMTARATPLKSMVPAGQKRLFRQILRKGEPECEPRHAEHGPA
jgi:hypothetical protein